MLEKAEINRGTEFLQVCENRVTGFQRALGYPLSTSEIALTGGGVWVEL
jgi:hypothetical protein